MASKKRYLVELRTLCWVEAYTGTDACDMARQGEDGHGDEIGYLVVDKGEILDKQEIEEVEDEN